MSTSDSRRVVLDDGTQLMRAMWAWRLVARLIDMALVGTVVAWSFVQAADGLISFGGSSSGSPVLFLAFVVAAICYEPVAIAASGRTVGKVLVGIRVVRISDDGNPSFGKSWLRVVVPTVLMLSPLGLGWFAGWAAVGISVLMNKQQRGFHDKSADTVVVRRT